MSPIIQLCMLSRIATSGLTMVIHVFSPGKVHLSPKPANKQLKPLPKYTF